MRLVKALMDGVIGGAISAAIIVGAGVYYFLDVPSWLALVAGVVTGLGVRMMGKSDKPGPSYLCGAIAAMLSLAAFYGGTFAASSIMEAKVDETQIKLRANTLPNGMKNPPPANESADEVPATEGELAETSSAEESTAEEPGTESTPAADDATPPEETPDAEADPAAGESATEEVVEEEVAETLEPVAVEAAPPVVKMDRPQAVQEEFNVLSYVFIVVGALIAYELGRSCGGNKVA